MYQTTTTTKQTIFILRGPLKEKQREQTRAPSAVTKAVVSGLRYTSTTNVIIFSLLEQCLGLLSVDPPSSTSDMFWLGSSSRVFVSSDSVNHTSSQQILGQIKAPIKTGRWLRLQLMRSVSWSKHTKDSKERFLNWTCVLLCTVQLKKKRLLCE